MAKLNYSSIQNDSTASGGNHTTNVGFFRLQNDGDRALVRIMYTDPSEFEIFREHFVTTSEGRFKSVSCLRTNDTTDPINACPLCAANEQRRDRFYIKLLQYTVDANGNVNVEAKVWDRPVSQAKRIAGMLSEYGPLTDCLLYIKRNGARGSKETSYDFTYAVSENKTPERYPLKPELFDGFNVFGMRVLNKTAEDMIEFLTKREFPKKSYPQTSNEHSVENAQDGNVVNANTLGFKPNSDAQFIYDAGQSGAPNVNAPFGQKTAVINPNNGQNPTAQTFTPPFNADGLNTSSAPAPNVAGYPFTAPKFAPKFDIQNNSGRTY